MRYSQRGSATVELAFAIPLLTFLFLLMAQIGVVMLDQLAVTQASREAARVAAVSSSSEEAAAAARKATRLSSDRLEVTVGPRPTAEGLVRVEVKYRSSIRVPFSGRSLLEPTVVAASAMAVER